MPRVRFILVLVTAFLAVPRLALADGPTVTITSPGGGGHVRGTVVIAATADAATVSLTFDRSTDGGTTFTTVGTDTDPSDGWSVPWDTTKESDGPVTLRATAAGPAGAGSDTVDVVVDNTAPGIVVHLTRALISPNGDGTLDRTTAGVRVSEPSTLAVRVADARGVVLRTLATARPVAKGTTTFVWKGFHGEHPAADGTYRVVATATDAAGNVSTARAAVRVDTTPPRVLLRSTAPPGSGPMSIAYTLRDASPPLRLHASLLDDVGVLRTVAAGVHGAGDGSVRVPVRRTDGTPFRPGLYRVQLAATDAAGNRGVSATAPFVVQYPVHTQVWREVPGAGRRVSLTFDDCNDHDAWNRILDLLDAAHVHTTFFCIGGNVVRYPDMARKTIALGDSVGDHTWDHADLVGMSLDAVRSDIAMQAAAWWKVARVTPLPYFRPPYGAYDDTTLAAAGSLGFTRTMLWSVDPQDWRRPGAGVIASEVLSTVGPGDVVVMHVQAQTADALPTILAGLRHRHLLQSSLPELFAAAGLR